VHREERVVRRRVDERDLGTRQLRAQNERLDAAEDEEEERGDDVALADALVVGGRHPARLVGRRLPHAGEALLEGRGRAQRTLAHRTKAEPAIGRPV